MKKIITEDKDCYCFTCRRDFHYLGISKHRKMHMKKKQDCKISYTNGKTVFYNFSEEKKNLNMTLSQIAAAWYKQYGASYYVNFLSEVYSNDLLFIEKVAQEAGLFYQDSDFRSFKYMVKPVSLS